MTPSPQQRRRSLVHLLTSSAAALTVALSVTFSLQANAQFVANAHASGFPSGGFQSASLQTRQEKTISAAQAAKIAQARYGGKVLSVERIGNGEDVRYKVKLLQDNGRVKTVIISG